MENKFASSFRGLYIMYLNIPHRRLVVDDTYRLVDTLAQKRVYSSCGCLLLQCPFTYRTCNKCVQSYNILEL